MKKFCKLLLICLLLIEMTGCKEKYTRIVVISDLHYLSDSLYNDSPYFDEMIKKADAKITPYSKELLNSLINDMKNLDAEAIVLLGDMSFNGEKVSHEEISAAFNSLNISLMAAPVGAVTIPILVGYLGIGFLCSLANKPSCNNFLFSFSNSTYKEPNPSTSM